MEPPELLGLGDSYLTIVVFSLVVAVLFAATRPAAIHTAARLAARFARALLTA
ncbi:hypothetical protein [Actinoplanes siamensis]|uniref:Uncharacterized protein n=1 Tax=Actinoplanes siamensis TaxID=1223317 RepID=A0A919N426_9ACTN|nr:hypothetical protein [Actinoplanes siamensis]GIF03944.1 hypothetical protein Asi03nite_14820 [Actinoplanes siamensis]